MHESQSYLNLDWLPIKPRISWTATPPRPRRSPQHNSSKSA